MRQYCKMKKNCINQRLFANFLLLVFFLVANLFIFEQQIKAVVKDFESDELETTDITVSELEEILNIEIDDSNQTYEDSTNITQKNSTENYNSILYEATMKKLKTSAESLNREITKFENIRKSNNSKVRDSALKKAETPKDLLNLIKELQIEQENWNTGLKKLNVISGGLTDGQPKDILLLEKRYIALKRKLPSIANNQLEKRLLDFYKEHPIKQANQHTDLKKYLIKSIDDAITKYLTEKINGVLKNRSNVVSVAVYDQNSDFEFIYNGNPTYGSASTVKVLLMAGLLYDAKLNSRELTNTERNLIRPMITVSDNNSTTRLWRNYGGKQKTERLVKELKMTSTKPEFAWGLTRTTPKDQVQLLKHLAYPNNVFTDKQRQYALDMMTSVVTSQKWGVSGGVSANVKIAIKNGWSPKTAGNWRINSFGHIKGQNRDYVISVMTIRNPSMNYGIRTIEEISKIIWDTF